MGWDLGIDRPRQNPVPFERAEGLRQDLGRYAAGRSFELSKAARPVRERADHQDRPAAADEVKDRPRRALRVKDVPLRILSVFHETRLPEGAYLPTVTLARSMSASPSS